MDMADELRAMAREANARGVSFETIARNSGVTLTWLMKFMAGSIKNPRIDTYSKLHASLLSGRKRKPVAQQARAA